MSSISFGDVVKLVDDRIGTVRFIGCTEFSTDTPYYGLQLKQPVFEYDEYTLNTTGITDRKHYFNSPRNHGLFVERCDIKQIIRKHTSSASYSYNQIVKVLNLGKGTIKYIGLTHFGNSYWYGIVLETRIFLQIKTNAQQNNCIHYLSPNELNIYFDSDYQKSIFVRSNQLRRIKVTKQPKFHAEDTVNIISTNGYEEYINKTLISMMNHLNIPQTARPAIINMDSSKKVALIQQWFIISKKTCTAKTLSVNEEKQNVKTKETNKKPERIVHSNDIYSFEFRSKPFGITFGLNKNNRMNVFVTEIEENSTAEKENVIVGSKLVKIQDQMIENFGAKKIRKILKSKIKQLPVTITFRKPMDAVRPDATLYCIEFVSKPFGLTFKAKKEDKKNLFVTEIDENNKGFKGDVYIDSKIIKFEDEIMENEGAKKIHKILMNKYINQLPLRITFRKPMRNGDEKHLHSENDEKSAVDEDGLYSVKFTRKPFGMTVINLFVTEVKNNSDAFMGNVIIGSEIIKLQDNVIECMEERDIYRTYFHSLPLTITFRKPRGFNLLLFATQ
eukprot:304264_1